MNIEVKYLDVKWSDEFTVLKVEYSEDSLAIEQHEDYSQVESTTFKNYLPRIGLRILDKEALHPPCFIISDTKTQELLPVVDPTTHQTWWIESSGWDNKGKCHLSEIYRTVGSVSVKVQNKILKVINNSLRFTVDELEAYLRDFKNDLWMLILNEKGYIKGAIEKELPSIFHPEMVKCLQDYADAIERIIRKPTNELKEIQAERPVRSVKPVNRTFMELAARGNPKYLTSRACQESYDTSDNRYIHYTLNRVLYLLNQLAVLGHSQDCIYERIIAAEGKRLNSLSNMKQVDPVVFHNDIKLVDEKINRIKQPITKALINSGSQCSPEDASYRLRLTNKYNGKKPKNFTDDFFFCNEVNGNNFKEVYGDKGKYLVVALPFFIPIDKIVNKWAKIEISIEGVARKGFDINKNKERFFYLVFQSISNINIEDHPEYTPLYKERERLEKEKSNLEKVEWVIPYTNKEMEDVESERKFLRKKLELLSSRKDGIKGFNSSIIPIVRKLRGLKSFLEKASVGISDNFPNTMVFVQNPSYSLAKASFSKISNVNGMDESIFKEMMSIDEIGLVNISNLYEKWCLLQIIKILTEVYSFSISKNWQHDLIAAVSKKKYNIQFKMQSASLGRSIILTYEYQFEPGNPNSRRPDYVIDVFDWDNHFIKRYVLDAKFKDTLNDGTLADLINDLYTGKDYSEGQKNKVFILHASDSAIANRVSPLSWGRHSDYGQVNCHRYGGVYLSPSHKHGRSIDNLQRLIGLFLQESNEYDESEREEINDHEKSTREEIHHHPFCVACGNSDKKRLTINVEKTISRRDKWSVRCSVCNHLQVRSFCKSCHYPLNKNGFYWTYHRTRAEQPFNVVCPSCEEFL